MEGCNRLGNSLIRLNLRMVVNKKHDVYQIFKYYSRYSMSCVFFYNIKVGGWDIESHI